jgi:hypothetical protein
MLRQIILLLACLCLAGAVAATMVDPAAWPAVAVAGLLVLGTAFERFYYRGGGTGAGAGAGGRWQATSERFHDEETGGLVTVWFNPVTGERRYVNEGTPPPA